MCVVASPPTRVYKRTPQLNVFYRHHLKPASFKRWIFSSDSSILGIWLFWVFVYEDLSSLHHRPREAFSPQWETSQWPYFALKAMRSLKRSSNVSRRDHWKPASFKCWIFSSDSDVFGFWLFWIFLYKNLSTLHHRPSDTFSPRWGTWQWPYFALKAMRSLKRSSNFPLTPDSRMKGRFSGGEFNPKSLV